MTWFAGLGIYVVGLILVAVVLLISMLIFHKKHPNASETEVWKDIAFTLLLIISCWLAIFSRFVVAPEDFDYQKVEVTVDADSD